MLRRVKGRTCPKTMARKEPHYVPRSPATFDLKLTRYITAVWCILLKPDLSVKDCTGTVFQVSIQNMTDVSQI